MKYQLQIRFEPDYKKRRRMQEGVQERLPESTPGSIPSKAEELILISKKLEERFCKYNIALKIIQEDGLVSNSFELDPWGNLETWWDDFFDAHYVYEVRMLNQQMDLFSWRFENGACTECSKLEVKSCKPELITPEQALKWLEKTPENESFRNRDVIHNHVDELCAEMKAGRWNDTADPVEVLDNGVVLNGQHRLNAVVKAGMPVSINIRTYRESGNLFF
ncbi:MAG: hypothetical protein K6G80_04965 [Treponema sp.]|nr:hypothetical protein [Treponema sp.]